MTELFLFEEGSLERRIQLQLSRQWANWVKGIEESVRACVLLSGNSCIQWVGGQWVKCRERVATLADNELLSSLHTHARGRSRSRNRVAHCLATLALLLSFLLALTRTHSSPTSPPTPTSNLLIVFTFKSKSSPTQLESRDHKQRRWRRHRLHAMLKD